MRGGGGKVDPTRMGSSEPAGRTFRSRFRYTWKSQGACSAVSSRASRISSSEQDATQLICKVARWSPAGRKEKGGGSQLVPLPLCVARSGRRSRSWGRRGGRRTNAMDDPACGRRSDKVALAFRMTHPRTGLPAPSPEEKGGGGARRGPVGISRRAGKPFLGPRSVRGAARGVIAGWGGGGGGGTRTAGEM